MAILVMLCSPFFKAWPIHFHFLRFLIVVTSRFVLRHSSSFMMKFSQKMPSILNEMNVYLYTTHITSCLMAVS